jgi:hypothetical protein
VPLQQAAGVFGIDTFRVEHGDLEEVDLVFHGFRNRKLGRLPVPLHSPHGGMNTKAADAHLILPIKVRCSIKRAA